MNNFVGAGGAAYMSKSNEWETPHELFNELDDEFCFTLDPCSTDLNAKCARHYTAEDDGLTKSWTNERVFCNPPYGRDIAEWVKKCHESVSDGGAEVVVALIPARTDTRYFHEHIYHKAEIRFIRGRVKFERRGVAGQSAPFPSMICIWRRGRYDR